MKSEFQSDGSKANSAKYIDKDPDYWADQTMDDLLDSISGKKPS